MRVGIVGYGNLGRAIETVAEGLGDVDIFGVFTEAMQDAGFGNRPTAPQDHKKPQTGRKTTKK